MADNIRVMGNEASAVKIPEGPPPPAVFSNVARVIPTPNELVIDFALNLNAYGQLIEEETKVVSRVVTTYDGAKRLLLNVAKAVQAWEQRYGQIELDFAKRGTPEPKTAV
jgi:hypothetical protein